MTRPDMDALWMPFTDNRQFKRAPRLLVAAGGMYYTDADGRQVLDGAARARKGFLYQFRF